jgi:hypothetical protein
MTTATKTCLFPHEVENLTAEMTAEGVSLGLVRDRQIVERHCHCGELLPAVVWIHGAPRWDTFPRCSRHAF